MKIEITDIDKNLNSKDQFRIEISNVWHTIEAKDFFDYLWEVDKISGHDCENGIAWIQTIDYQYNPFTGIGRDVKKGTSNTYEVWIEEFIDDEVLVEYMQNVLLTKSLTEAA